MPAYRIDHDEFSKPRALECANPKTARAAIAREFKITRIDARECFDLAEQGVELVVAGKRRET